MVVLVMVLFTFFVVVLLGLAFSGILLLLPGMLSHIAGPIQHFQSAILDAWRDKVAGDLCGRKGFRGGPLLDIHGSLQLLNSSHVRERDKGLLRSVVVGGVWNGFLLGRVRNQVVPCRFCGAPDHDGHLFWECTFPPLVEIRENPEFHDLMRMDKAHWPRCLLWHGWLPMLSGCNGDSPWADTASESAHYLVEASLGGYSSSLVSSWYPPDGYDSATVSCIVPDSPNVWTDLSLIRLLVFPPPVLDSLLIILPLFGMFVPGGRLIIFTLLVIRLVEVSALFLCLISLYRGLRCGVLFWLYNLLVLFTLGVDNLGVVRHVGRMLDDHPVPIPFELLKDGDLLLLIDRMIRRRGPDTVRISKVKGHADEVMVRSGQVREVDRLGNNAADEAADFGRRRVSHAVIDARRNLSGVCNRWYPVLLDLHRFFIAVSRAVVNHDGGPGTAPDPLVWSAGAIPKRRRLVYAVIGAFMGSLCLLPGGLGGFVTCSIGANHCRLRHIGWEKCGHGLTSRPEKVLLCIFWMSS